MQTKEERKKYHAEWRKKNRKKWTAYSIKWRKAHPESFKRVQDRWEHSPKRLAYMAKWRKDNCQKIADLQRKRLLGYKRRIVDAYGGCCACCKEREITFLTVEHLQKNGMDHRKIVASGNLYLYLIKNNFPKEGLCILCMNCNWAERNGWPCPHKKNPSALTSAEQAKDS